MPTYVFLTRFTHQGIENVRDSRRLAVGGAVAEVDAEDSAFAGRHAPFLLGVEANWASPEGDDAVVIEGRFTHFRRAAETPTSLVFEAKAQGYTPTEAP